MPGITSAPAEQRLALTQSITSRGDGGSGGGAEPPGTGGRRGDGEGTEAALEGSQAWLTWIGVIPIRFK